MRNIVVTTILLLGLSGFPGLPNAHAQDDASTAQQVEQLSHKGAEHFGDGDFELAIEKFEAAYELEPVPNLLYNIGRCYEQLENWEQAKHYVDEFIRSPDVDSESRDHAMDRVQSLREIQEAEKDTDTEPDETPEEIHEEEDAVAEPDEVEEPNLIPGIATAGAGGALLLGGLFTGLAASSNADRISDTDLDYRDRLDARDTARMQGVAADVMYVGGAAATAVGIYLLVTAGDRVDSSSADSARLHRLSPWIGHDSTGVGVELDF